MDHGKNGVATLPKSMAFLSSKCKQICGRERPISVTIISIDECDDNHTDIIPTSTTF